MEQSNTMASGAPLHQAQCEEQEARAYNLSEAYVAETNKEYEHAKPLAFAPRYDPSGRKPTGQTPEKRKN